MKKKGFTLVELLAVIAILAILVIIALPNVMGMFNNAKKSSFETEVKNIVKYAGTEWMQKSLTMTTGNTDFTFDSSSNKITSLDSRAALQYTVYVNNLGHVQEVYVKDGTYWYSYATKDVNGMNAETVKTTDIKTEAETTCPTTKCVLSNVTSGPQTACFGK